MIADAGARQGGGFFGVTAVDFFANPAALGWYTFSQENGCRLQPRRKGWKWRMTC